MRCLVEGIVGFEDARRLVDQRQHPSDAAIEHVDVEFIRFDRSTHRLRAALEVGWHLPVQPGTQRGHTVVAGTPVGHDDTVPTPLVSQYLGQQPTMFRRIGPVDLVVGAHHRPRGGPLRDLFERRQIDLAQRALVDIRAHAQPIVFLVVRGEVLDGGPDTL